MTKNNLCSPLKGLAALFSISKRFRRACADAVKIIAVAVAVAIIAFTLFISIIAIKGIIIDKNHNGSYSVNTCDICDKVKIIKNEIN